MPSWDPEGCDCISLPPRVSVDILFYVVTALPPPPDHPSYYQNLFLFVVGGSVGRLFYVIVLGIPIYLSMPTTT